MKPHALCSENQAPGKNKGCIFIVSISSDALNCTNS